MAKRPKNPANKARKAATEGNTCRGTRENTKQAKVVELLRRPEGATIAHVVGVHYETPEIHGADHFEANEVCGVIDSAWSRAAARWLVKAQCQLTAKVVAIAPSCFQQSAFTSLIFRRASRAGSARVGQK